MTCPLHNYIFILTSILVNFPPSCFFLRVKVPTERGERLQPVFLTLLHLRVPLPYVFRSLLLLRTCESVDAVPLSEDPHPVQHPILLVPGGGKICIMLTFKRQINIDTFIIALTQLFLSNIYIIIVPLSLYSNQKSEMLKCLHSV